MTARWRIGAFCAVGTLAVSVSVGLAQLQPTQPPSQAQPSPVAAARKTVLDAQAAVNQVRAQMAQMRMTVSATFETRDDWIAAKKALAAAQTHYDTALKPVLAALQASPDYQKLLVHRQTAQKKLEELRNQPRPSDTEEQKAQDDQLNEAAGDVVNDGFAMNKLESDARNSDADLGTAKEELIDAKKTMDGLQAQVTTALQTDPNYQALTQQLTGAQQQLASARTALQAAETPQRSNAPSRPTPARRQY